MNLYWEASVTKNIFLIHDKVSYIPYRKGKFIDAVIISGKVNLQNCLCMTNIKKSVVKFKRLHCFQTEKFSYLLYILY